MHMVQTTKTIRNVDPDEFRLFRAKAVELGYTAGEALNEAMRMWLNAKNRPRVTVRAEVETSAPVAHAAA